MACPAPGKTAMGQPKHHLVRGHRYNADSTYGNGWRWRDSQHGHSQADATGRVTRSDRDPVCRGLWRRHAGHRRPIHERERHLRQRSLDIAELPGRDPGTRRHPGGSVGVPGAHLRPRHPHAGRRSERARGDEPGGATGEHRRRPGRRQRHRQLGRLRGPGAGEGRLRGEPARRRDALRLSRLRGAHDDLDPRGVQADGSQASRRRAEQELLRPRPRGVDVPAPDRDDGRLDRTALRPQRRRRRGEHAGVPCRLPLR